MEIIKLVLNLLVFILPFIFKKDSIYNEGIVKLNELLLKKRKEFEGLSDEEKSIAVSDLVDSLHNVLELRK